MGTRKIKIIHKQFKFKIEIAYVDPWDMLNNFCFHVYAQKWYTYMKCKLSSVSNDVDHWDMLNNFCFYVYALTAASPVTGPIIELVPS